MELKSASMKREITDKIIELASALGNDVSGLRDDEILPEKGYLDSASIIELVVWLEDYFEITLEDSEITLENLGSINAMTNYIQKKKRG